MLRRPALALGLVAALLTAAAPPAAADQVDHWVTVSDGVALKATLTSTVSAAGKPTVVEFSPYGRNTQTLPVSSEYNYLLVQIRGTGDSHGSFDALGPRSQRDVTEVLRWACRQPFSNGRLALAGFSASAIIAYNSWHRPLPCVKAAVMRSGTHELYRDLLVPGGVLNLVPGAGVLTLIGAAALAQGADRDPATIAAAFGGLFTSGTGVLAHPTLDAWWRQRGWRGDANSIPVLIINGFFDVESRGAFQAYQSLKADGAHLLMVGGHDGHPAGTDGGNAEAAAWLDHFVRGVDNGVETHPRVQLLMSNGDRQAYLAGDYSTATGTDWPLPGTTWKRYHLDASGGLTPEAPAASKKRIYTTVPSIPTMTDVPNNGLVGAAGLDALTGALPLLGQGAVSELSGLTYTTAPFTSDLHSAGPLSLELPLSTSVPGSGIWAVISDVAPDGTAHPLTVGRLNTNFPHVIRAKSLKNAFGTIVQPYGDYSTVTRASPLVERRYTVEFWPVGNVFAAGHRLRLTLVGTSAASLSLPAIHVVRTGGENPARLFVPSLP